MTGSRSARIRAAATCETIRANGFDECYIRPVVYRGVGQLGVNPFHSPVEVLIAVQGG